MTSIVAQAKFPFFTNLFGAGNTKQQEVVSQDCGALEYKHKVEEGYKALEEALPSTRMAQVTFGDL
jgi:hypothetical protein